jgi:PHD/YefM family antitoxin component YafN of YafNO toxin-antitoxin module
MKTIELNEASEPLSHYANELGDEVIVLTRDHSPVAALVSLKDVDRESLALSTNAEFLSIIEASRAQCARGETVSLEEMRRAVLPKPRGRRQRRGGRG